MWNPKISDHFYTTSAAGRDNAIADYGYVNEGIACYVLPDGDPAGTPLYRLWSPKIGDHFYTTSAVERDNAIADYGYVNEGIVCYVLPDGDPAGTPLYRLWNPMIGDHLYTTSAAERDNAIADYGYAYEHIAYVVVLREVHSETLDVLQRGGDFTFLPCNNNLTALGVSEEATRGAANETAVETVIESGLGEIAALTKPVFYQDNHHILFIEPDVTERTIEEWQEWVTRTPQPEPGWLDPDWWKSFVVIPEVPWKRQIPDELHFPVDPRSLIKPKLDRDWLVNAATAIRFGDVLIGPRGRAGLEVLSAIGDGASRRLVRVNPASDLAGGNSVILRDENTFARSGLNVIGGGLNIVGGAGFNSALERNFNDLNRSGFGSGATDRGRMGH